MDGRNHDVNYGNPFVNHPNSGVVQHRMSAASNAFDHHQPINHAQTLPEGPSHHEYMRSTPTPSFASDHYPGSFTGIPAGAPTAPVAVVQSGRNGYYNPVVPNPGVFANNFPQNIATVNPEMSHYYAMQQQQQRLALEQWVRQYNQWYQYIEHQKREREQASLPVEQRARLTPLHFPHRHARVSFGATNQLIVIQGNTVVIQQIDPTLLDFGEEIQVTTWPGPLVKGETKKDDVLEYIRTLESSLKFKTGMMHTMSASSSNLDELDSVSLQNSEAYYKSHERRQLWSLLSMLVRQNGSISGADLAELLLANNESDFEAPEEGDDVGRVRKYLTLGQKKTALEYAQKTGLWGHVSSLILFNTLLSSTTNGPMAPPSVPLNSPDMILSQQMCSMVSKFINSTLSREDALFMLYRCLLTKLQSKTHKSQENNNGNKSVTTDNLQQFAILIANDCDVSPIVSSYGRSSELLKLMVSMKNQVTQHLINLGSLDLPEQGSNPGNSASSVSVKYTDELVFLNEIWEFSRNQTEFIELLIPFKTILAARLFDFGLINQATKYCYALRQYFTYYNLYFSGKNIKDDSILDWDTLMTIITDLECRIYGFDVISSSNEGKQSSIPSPSKEILKDDSRDTPEGSSETRNQVVKSASPTKKLGKKDVGDSLEGQEDTLGEQRPRNTSVKNSSVIKNQQQTYPRGESDRPASRSNRNRSDSTSSQSNNPYQHHPVQRRRTLSREDSQETSPSPPSDSPVKQTHFNPVPTFDQMSLNRKRDSVGHESGSPLAGNFNFVSSPMPTLHGESGTQHPGLQPYSEEDTFEDSSLRRDSFASPHQPFSSTQRHIPFNTSSAGLVSAPFDAAFSPITSPEPFSITSPVNQQPQQQFGSNNGNVRRNSFSGETTKGDDNENKLDKDEESKANKSKGWLGSVGSLFNRAPRAILPDDSKKSIVWDEQLKMWVDKDDPDSVKQAAAVLSGPPKGLLPSMASKTHQMTSNGSVPSALPVQEQPPSSGPSSLPMMPAPPAASGNTFNYVKGVKTKKRPQYIDVWQQTQKKN